MTNNKTRDLVTTALMAALVFVATFLIRIPNPLTGGYHHIGDSIIFLAVVLIGRKNGAIAAGIGGALSDFLAGAPIWILPTFLIKFCMARLMGTVVQINPDNRKVQIIGAIVGGTFQVAAYTLVNMILIDVKSAIVTIPNEALQTAVGIVLFVLLSSAFSDTLKKYIKK